MRAIRSFFPLAILSIFMLLGVATEAAAKPARPRRAPSAPAAPYKVTGVVQGVTDSRLFIKTPAGVEHMIKIDGRTAVIGAGGEAGSVSPAALLQAGEVVEVELDQRDLIKSAVRVSLPPQVLVKK